VPRANPDGAARVDEVAARSLRLAPLPGVLTGACEPM
jgi:hypothetical protein